MWYSHRTRASQAALLEVIYHEEPSDERYHTRTAYPIFNCSSPETALEIRKSVGDISGDIPSPGDARLETFPQTRLNSLKEAYRSGRTPEGWRLAECVFPPVFGDKVPIRLVSLLKPVEAGYKTAYCVALYR